MQARNKKDSEIQVFLKGCGVVTTSFKNYDLVALCSKALGIEPQVDLDGLLEDKTEIIANKLSDPSCESMATMQVPHILTC